MMYCMHFSRLVSAVLFCLILASACPSAHAEEEKPHELTSANDVNVYPIAPVNWDSCKDVKLYDRQFMKLHFELKNISDGKLKVNAVIPACPCLSLEKEFTSVELAPGGAIPVDFKINAGKLKLGAFERYFVVEVEGHKNATMRVNGTVAKPMKFEPNQILQLGRFIGDVPWKRTVTIVSLLEDDSLKILPPAPNALLNVVVSKVAPKQFKVDISPKGTLPKKQNKVALLFPVEGIPNYASVEIGVLFEPTGWRFQAENAKLTIDKAETNLAEPCVVEGRLVLAKAPPKQPPKHYWGHKPPKDPLENNPSIAVVSVADNEENKAHPLSSPETWKPHLDKVAFPYLPENVKVEKVPSNGGIVLKFTLPGGFFNDERTSVRVPVTYNGSPVATLSIVAQ